MESLIYQSFDSQNVVEEGRVNPGFVWPEAYTIWGTLFKKIIIPNCKYKMGYE